MVVNLYLLRFTFAILVILGCTACSEVNSGVTTIKPSPFSTYSEDPNSDLGSRNNPIALGKPVLVNDWQVQVISVNKDATKIVLNADPYTSPPSSNERFLILKIRAVYVGNESSEPSSDLTFKIVGSRGNSFSKSCGYSVDTFDNNGETFPGASVEGNLCFAVETNQIDGATVSIQGGFAADDRKFVLIN